MIRSTQSTFLQYHNYNQQHSCKIQILPVVFETQVKTKSLAFNKISDVTTAFFSLTIHTKLISC